MKKSREEIDAQAVVNNALAAEYKLAAPDRRGEILKEYYAGNTGFVIFWRYWDHEHWAELTQIFVSYWHEAFMLYRPQSENSVFNNYMDRKYKSLASSEYKRFIKKESWDDLEFTSGDGRREPRPEIFIHPQSDFDRIALKRQLSRSLDDQEMVVLEEYFFGDKTLREIDAEAPESWHGGMDSRRKGIKMGFNLRYQKMLDKLYLNCDREGLRQSLSRRDECVPVRHETLYNTKKRRAMA